SVDLPEPLRPIRQTRSPGDTESSTPASSGVPPKVSLMSLSWISGGAIASVLARGRLLSAAALDTANGLVGRREECGAVARRKRLGSACDFTGRSQVGHQVPHGQRHPDRLFGKWLAVRCDHLGARFDTAACQRNVRRDDNITMPGAFRDPVVG